MKTVFSTSFTLQWSADWLMTSSRQIFDEIFLRFISAEIEPLVAAFVFTEMASCHDLDEVK